MKTFDVLYEDNHLIIVNKVAGVLVQADRTGDETLTDHVKAYIKEKYDKPGEVYLHPVHRIDRPVTGLVIFARTSKALERMNKLFLQRKIHKVYWALTKKKPKYDTAKVSHWLVKDERSNFSTAHDEEVEGSKKAELSYKVLGKMNDFYLLEVLLYTGRPHQIRCQLAAIGCPIRGDVKYGADKGNPDRSIHLHARRVNFIHPVKQEPVSVTAGLPSSQFWEQFLALDSAVKVRDKDLDLLY